MVELSTKETRWRGLSYLIKHGREIGKDAKGQYYIPTPIKEHPFGLPVPKQPALEHALEHEQGVIEFVGYPGYTDVSVNNMIRRIAEVFYYLYANSQLNYLRVVLGEASSKDRNHHMVYYEVGSTVNILMCGGCTDFSGEGGSGKVSMDEVFAVLSCLFEIEIETVIIPYEKAEPAQRRLEKAVDEYQRT